MIRCWWTKPNLRLSGYLWVAAMFGVLAALEANRIGVFLVPPFAATLTILVLLPDASVAQPYALITGSVRRCHFRLQNRGARSGQPRTLGGKTSFSDQAGTSGGGGNSAQLP
jgi:uncharacterized membrane protein YgcG